MRHRKRGRILDRPRGARQALLRSLIVALLREERIRTTLAKAKEVRGKVERLVTYAKKGGVAMRRLAAREIHDRNLIAKLFDELAPRFKEREGGYTRIFHLECRLGDAAPMAQIELLGAPSVIKPEDGKTSAKKKDAPKYKAKKTEVVEPPDEKPKRKGLRGLFGGKSKKTEDEGKEKS